MTHTEIWIIILLMGAGTFVIRLSFILLQDYWTMPAGFREALRYVPPAVFAALITPSIVVRDSHVLLTPDNHRLLAALAACGAMALTKNVLATIATGLVALWTLNWLLV